jgi:cellobionic acid phosphorylase
MEPAAAFIEDGRRYRLSDPLLVDAATAHLFTPTLDFSIDHRGRCRAHALTPNPTPYAGAARGFLLRDDATGQRWRLPYDPLDPTPERFAFMPGLDDIRWEVTQGSVDAQISMTLLHDMPGELWEVTLINRGEHTRFLSCYTDFPIGQLGYVHQHARYDTRMQGILVEYFPYYVRVEDYFRLREGNTLTALLADAPPDAWETSQRAWQLGGSPERPQSLEQSTLANGHAYYEPTVAAMQYRITLPPGGSVTRRFLLAPARSRATLRALRQYLAPDGMARALEERRCWHAATAPTVHIDTPDTDLNHFVNHWLPEQVNYCGGHMRLAVDPCVRNLFQDAMGIVYQAPHLARRWFTFAFTHQHADGWMPHGAPLGPDVQRSPINTIPHRDMNVWPPLAIAFYLRETGDLSLLDQPVEFADADEVTSVYDHVCRGLEWQLTDRTDHGLSRIGEGDWDDPLNMAGWQERGESVWLTEALAAALDEWNAVAVHLGDADRAVRYSEEAQACRDAVNRYAWDGEWYARGTTDNGRWFGSHHDREGRIFLNAQSWALIAGVDTPERRAACLRAVNRLLMTPWGPMTLTPPFTRMYEDIGKISLKTPGTGENGSVYCHAATFYAYALYRIRQRDAAYRVLRRLLPGTPAHGLTQAAQLPLFLPNAYLGRACRGQAGRSSGQRGTGTAAWYYRTLVGELFGLRAEFGGLRVDPQLPRGWRRASITREFRGAVYTFAMRVSRGAHALEVRLDDRRLPDNLLPIQQPGTRHHVDVRIPG